MASRTTKLYLLALQIHDLLDLPLDAHGDPVIGYKIIKAITTSMVNGLRRGERIYIKGFGIFEVKDRKPHRTGSNFLTQAGDSSPVPFDGRAKRVVTFQPSEQILAMLNRGTTWDEKRAMEIW